MSKKLYLGSRIQPLNNSGVISANIYLKFTEPGDASTLKNIYSDVNLTIPLTNPIQMDGYGRKAIWLNGNYDVYYYDGDPDAGGTLLYSDTDVNPDDLIDYGNYNKLKNGSFEDDSNSDGTPDYWVSTTYTGGTAALDSTENQRGTKSVKFTSTGNGGGYYISEDYFEVNPNQDIEGRFSLKSSTAAVRNLVEVVWYTSAQAQISATTLYDENAGNPTSWKRFRGFATPPATARYAKLRFYGCHESDSTTGSTWYDDIVLRDLPDKPVIHVPTVGGTADAITGTCNPAITSLIDGMIFTVEATAANTTTTPTFQLDSLTAYTIKKNGNQALAAGDIYGAGHKLLLQYDSANTVWELLNPAFLENIAVTDGNFIVGDGSKWVAESGSTARTSLGLDAGSTGTSLVLIDSDVATGSTGNIVVTGLSSTYKSYIVHVVGIIPSTNGVAVGFNVSTNGGSSYESTNYGYRTNISVFSGTDGTAASASTSAALLTAASGDYTLNSSTTGGLNAVVHIYDPSSTSKHFEFDFSGTMYAEITAGDSYAHIAGAGVWAGTTAVDTIRLTLSAGTIASGGAIYLYGVKNS